jgi:hypothetical protein
MTYQERLDMFRAAALQGLLAAEPQGVMDDAGAAAKAVCEYADALMDEAQKRDRERDKE